MAKLKTFEIAVTFEAYNETRGYWSQPDAIRLKVRAASHRTATDTALGFGRSQTARDMAEAWENFEKRHPWTGPWMAHSRKAEILNAE